MATISGTVGRDVLFDTVQADLIDAGQGDDFIRYSLGADVINGGDGNDIIAGTRANFNASGLQIDGGSGNDYIDLYYANGNDIVFGGLGNDIVRVGTSSSDQFYGGDGSDRLYFSISGSAGASVYFQGDGGFDAAFMDFDSTQLQFIGLSADGVLTLQVNNHYLYTRGVEALQFTDRTIIVGSAEGGLSGTVAFDPSANADTVVAGAGDDLILVREGANTIVAGDGNDIVADNSQFIASGNQIFGGTGSDYFDLSFISSSVVYGNDGNDTARVFASGTQFIGGNGADNLIWSASGSAFFDGGADFDAAYVDLNFSDLQFIGKSADGTVTVQAGGNYLYLQHVEAIQFSDQTLIL